MVYVVVGIAGILGALSRYYLGLFIDTWWHHIFPLATLSINLIGCFLLSWLTMYVSRLNILHPYLVTGIGTGFIGSFTTFSTFSVETVRLIQHAQWSMALLYVLSSLWGGLFMSWLGFQIGNILFIRRTQKRLSLESSGGKK
ncbi:fluoride efflux transporter CrcB [Thermaerobacillus caldiproteolyticus]|uniref:Fluoride-specific ion channel FluC n=1 Tax=Thermaerobacillus caldiproteolyticus TaxID=247480 RepID=A0A7W0BZ21_9BACL|nr:fluoride efflux transporter CrcB [Anoxybacillus caldiproteolyticus]MBA2875573.1 CrcB protein [Anoxybacillus caldiproteolyticus]